MSDEHKSKRVTDADQALINAAKGEGKLYVLDAKALEGLSQAATKTWEDAWEKYESWVTRERAMWIRSLRVDHDYTWRAIAQAAYTEWGGDWSPPSNQIIGMVLCDAAAHVFDEHYMEAPWN